MTREQFDLIAKSATPENRDKYFTPLLNTMEKYFINTPVRQAMFIAQLLHESGHLKAIRENLNYSKEGLLAVFPKYFNPEQAAAYARKPIQIANKVYANRMGNGDERSGDGWKNRGGGAFQLTGADNYRLWGHGPEEMEKPELWADSAGWFWNRNNLNRFADVRDFKGLTKAINGGYNGLEDRTAIYNNAFKILTK